MVNTVLLYIGAGLVSLWGISHLIPTRSVVEGFGDISEDNRNIIAMEWIVEGVALVMIGVLVATVSMIDSSTVVSRAVYLICASGLLVLALVSLLTGFKVKFLPFRLCPLVLTVSALLVLAGGLL